MFGRTHSLAKAICFGQKRRSVASRVARSPYSLQALPSGAPVREHASAFRPTISASMSKVPFRFSNLHGKVVWTRRVHMQTTALISSYAPVVVIILVVVAVSPVLLFLGFPATAAPDVERNGPAPSSILVLAGAAATVRRAADRKRLAVEHAQQPGVFRLSP